VSAYLYPVALAILSALVFGLERLFAWRRSQNVFPRSWPSDLVHLAVNGHLLGVIMYGVAERYVLPVVDGSLARVGLTGQVHRDLAADWPLWAQILVALLAIDFMQWCVHNLLHRVPFLWEMHKTHHSVVDGEMSWIVSFRFQWTEVVVYRALLYFPLAYLGFGGAAVLTHAIFGTLIGHLNHANLPWSYGPLRYVLNNPKMHLWHHDYAADARSARNFGIIFSLWDWLFGTASMPDDPPARLGFRGVESFPRDFFGQQAWPLSRWVARPAAAVATVALFALGWWLH